MSKKIADIIFEKEEKKENNGPQNKFLNQTVYKLHSYLGFFVGDMVWGRGYRGLIWGKICEIMDDKGEIKFMVKTEREIYCWCSQVWKENKEENEKSPVIDENGQICCAD